MVFWVSVIGCVYLLYFPTIAVIKGTSFNATVRSNMVDNTVRFISLRRSSVPFDGFLSLLYQTSRFYQADTAAYYERPTSDL